MQHEGAMIGFPRRTVLAGIGIALGTPWHARARRQDAVQQLRGVLDQAARDPAAGLAALATFDPRALPPSARLDLVTARAGLAIDVARARCTGPEDSARAYALRLRRTTGDDIDPAQLGARLEQAQAQAMARADRLFARIGLRAGSLGERYTALWHDPRWLYPDSDSGRARAVADMNRWLAVAATHLSRWFGPLPPMVRAVRVARMSEEEEAAGRQGYRQLPGPGRPGLYVVDLREIRRRPAWTLPAVVHHELLPGHMIQLPIEAGAAPHPLRIDYAQSFTEGWAIYAEGLAAAAGLYRGDPRAELGFWHWRLFRIARARADLAMHLRGKQRAEVLAAWQAVLGEPAYFAPFATDVDRIARDPATRAAEAAMWLAIEDRAHGRPLPAFHRELLVHGRMRAERMP